MTTNQNAPAPSLRLKLADGTRTDVRLPLATETFSPHVLLCKGRLRHGELTDPSRARTLWKRTGGTVVVLQGEPGRYRWAEVRFSSLADATAVAKATAKVDCATTGPGEAPTTDALLDLAATVRRVQGERNDVSNRKAVASAAARAVPGDRTAPLPFPDGAAVPMIVAPSLLNPSR